MLCYYTVQLNLNLTEHAGGMGSLQHNFHFFTYICNHAYACRTDDIKPIVQSFSVYTNILDVFTIVCRCTCTYKSGMHTPNLDCVHFGMHANCKPRTVV